MRPCGENVAYDALRKRYEKALKEIADCQYCAGTHPARVAKEALEAQLNRAISVMQRWIVPGGISAEDAMREMTEILDSPEQRAAMGSEAETERRCDVSEPKKLSPGHKHMLRLIRQDADAEGWTPVSHAVAPLFMKIDQPGGPVPSALCEYEILDDGRGRARLTEAGRNLLDAMAWL